MDKILRIFDSQIKEVNEKERSVVALVSTGAWDRQDEVLLPEGADLKNYRKNPVVMWAHDYNRPPIGKAAWIKTTDDGILAKTIFANTPFASEVLQLYKDGFMKAFSIGFIPKEHEDGDGEKKPRRTYTDWEVIEYSAVPIPANPEALMMAIQKGTISEIIKKDIDSFAKEIDTKPEPEVTEDYIRMRVRSPSLFIDDSFRTITLSASRGIKAVIGKLKTDPDGSTHVQSVLFDKDKWEVEEAQSWMNEHRDQLKTMADDIMKKTIFCPECQEAIEIESREKINTMEIIEPLQRELTQEKEKTKTLTAEIAKLSGELFDARVALLDAYEKLKSISGISGDELVKTISEIFVREIRHAQGRLD